MIITIDCGCAAASTVQTILVGAGPIDDLAGWYWRDSPRGGVIW